MTSSSGNNGGEISDELAALFGHHRPYLFAVAYRFLGIAEDAEDVLQEAWLRLASARPDDLEEPRAYLVTIVSRLCLDLLRSARRRREEYVGVWLPEPVPSPQALPEGEVLARESASFAFLLLLERLSPRQRVVLVLHDVFDFRHREIATIIGSSLDASRQILRRARRALVLPRPPVPTASPELIDRFYTATREGDLEALLATLAPDVVLLSDGGGRVSALPQPLAGRWRVGRFLIGVSIKTAWGPVQLQELNAQPALLIYQQGKLTNAMLLEAGADGVRALYVVRNPDKLAALGARWEIELA
ncbi:MAG: RNA polymerase sigma factor SigJ [Acidobacteriota bacterium]